MRLRLALSPWWVQGLVQGSSWPGPVPTDPRQREAAGDLLRRRRESAVASRRWSVVVFAAAIVLYVVLAVTQTWLWWLAATLFLVFVVLTLTTVPRLDKRLALLADDAGSASPTKPFPRA